MAAAGGGSSVAVVVFFVDSARRSWLLISSWTALPPLLEEAMTVDLRAAPYALPSHLLGPHVLTGRSWNVGTGRRRKKIEKNVLLPNNTDTPTDGAHFSSRSLVPRLVVYRPLR